MTYVKSTSASSLNSNRRIKYYNVEIITFDRDSYMEEIKGRNSAGTAEIAASQYDEAEYIMIQGCYQMN